MHIDDLRSQKCEIPWAVCILTYSTFTSICSKFLIFLWTLTLGRNMFSVYVCVLGTTSSKEVVQIEQYCSDNPSVCSYSSVLQYHQPLY